ncbi:MAG: hypothetical protein ACKO4S_08655 [Snowella sp.]
MNSSLALLEQAAQAILKSGISKPAGDELVAALLDLEKEARYEKSSHCFRELVGNWRLCFITGTQKARNRAGIVLGAGRYLFPGIKIEIHFQETTQDQGEIENIVQVGTVRLSVKGPVKFLSKKNLLAFDFTRMRVQILGIPLYDGYIRGGKVSEESFYQKRIAQQAFFAYFVINPQILAARGKGGGLALWAKTSP